jgi:hypothetical protein
LALQLVMLWVVRRALLLVAVVLQVQGSRGSTSLTLAAAQQHKHSSLISMLQLQTPVVRLSCNKCQGVDSLHHARWCAAAAAAAYLLLSVLCLEPEAGPEAYAHLALAKHMHSHLCIAQQTVVACVRVCMHKPSCFAGCM